jgi:kynurenine formamidase
MSTVLTQLVAALGEGAVKVVELTQTLKPSTPVSQLPPDFAPTPPCSIEESSHYDERGPAWYWNSFACGEHTGTHY